MDARALAHQREQVQLALGARRDADHAIRPPVASACRFSARLGAPTSSRITSKGPCSAKPSRRDRLGAERGDLLAQLLAAHGRGHARAGARAELDRGRAHAAGAAVHEQALAGAQLAPA